MCKVLNRHSSKKDIPMASRLRKGANIVNHQGNANQNLNEIPLHTLFDGYLKKKEINKKQKITKGWQETGEKKTKVK